VKLSLQQVPCSTRYHKSIATTKSFISAASRHKLNEAVAKLVGLKKNVIVGHRTAGTGMREYDHTIVGSKERLQ
jgi:hypothetical protein